MADKLAVFDFDRTLIDTDSDATVIEMLSSRQPPPDWESGNVDWTSFMDDILDLVHAAGFSKEDILERIGGMRAVRGAHHLVCHLADAGWDVILLTDSNSVFVHHWLKTHELEDKVTAVITNPASWSSAGRLQVSPHTHQLVCPRCPANLCKSLALAMYRERRRAPYCKVVYIGDGRNDACPMTSLTSQDVVCPRVGYPCEKVLLSSPPAARVLPWRDHYDIMRDLFPDQPPRIGAL